MSILLGVIADDFTGATDIANTLAKEGMRVVQTIGVPDSGALPEANAVVIALKSRTAPVQDAVDWSLGALEWLLGQGAQQIVFKYCSTFDSTPQGNIGPVADALQTRLGEKRTVICPAFPENGRIVKVGHLYVNGTPLHESPMRDHPLTPMWDSSLKALMGAQSQGTVGEVGLDVVRQGPAAISAAMAAIEDNYIAVDATTDDDLRTIGGALANSRLLSGGSGIATGLPQNYLDQGQLTSFSKPGLPAVVGRSLILSGSASVATQSQVAYAKARMPAIEVNLDRVAEQSGYIDEICDWVLGRDASDPVLVYGTSSGEVLRRNQEKYGVAKSGEMLENTLSQVASTLASEGFTRIVVAGGETSGAVVSALGIKTLQIRDEIAPGVPWCEVPGTPARAIALKSGNFGQESFFIDALEMLE
ncbi:MAG: 3-oxo-tetronate kinase [Pseudomonadota bacterium]